MNDHNGFKKMVGCAFESGYVADCELPVVGEWAAAHRGQSGQSGGGQKWDFLHRQ